MELLDELLTLERAGWDSLCNGTGAAFYGHHMTEDAVMILAGGFTLDRPGVVRSLADSPEWDSYELAEARVVGVGSEGAALTYRGTAVRGSEEPFVAWMASTYVRVDGEWRLAVYQQTPVG